MGRKFDTVLHVRKILRRWRSLIIDVEDGRSCPLKLGRWNTGYRDRRKEKKYHQTGISTPNGKFNTPLRVSHDRYAYIKKGWRVEGHQIREWRREVLAWWCSSRCSLLVLLNESCPFILSMVRTCSPISSYYYFIVFVSRRESIMDVSQIRRE